MNLLKTAKVFVEPRKEASNNDWPVLKSHDTLIERGTIVENYAMQEKKERLLYEDRVKNWLNKLDEEMDLILIVEWLPESLILLRRKFCWSMRDILILNVNSRSYQFKVSCRNLGVNFKRYRDRLGFEIEPLMIKLLNFK